MDARPGGPAAKRQPSPEGLGINPQDDMSAVGAALNPFPLSSRSPQINATTAPNLPRVRLIRHDLFPNVLQNSQ
jgi:hypothetical protein